MDNTLLDNDRVQADLKRYLEREFGTESSNRYWAIFYQLRVLNPAMPITSVRCSATASGPPTIRAC